VFRSIIPLSVCAVLLSAGAARAQSEEELTQARATFAEGVELLGRSQWAEAAARFREVMAVRPTAQVKYNLGLALSHLDEEEVRQSRRLLREASEDETLPRDLRAGARRRLDEIGPGEEADLPPAEPEEEATSEPSAMTLGQPFTGQRPFMIEAHAGVSFWGIGFVSGLRLHIPLVHNLVASFNNALYLSLGADFYYVREGDFANTYGPGIGIPVAAHFEVYFDATWSAFIELGAQFFVHPRTFRNDRFDAYEPGFWIVAAIGGTWRLAPNFALTLRVGTPYASVALAFLI
jgi:hypothetical protein